MYVAVYKTVPPFVKGGLGGISQGWSNWPVLKIPLSPPFLKGEVEKPPPLVFSVTPFK